MYQPNGVPSSSLAQSNPLVRSQSFECGGSPVESMSGGNNASNNANLASKQRLRWTHELHERFVDAVAQLGGPDREFLYSYRKGTRVTKPMCGFESKRIE